MDMVAVDPADVFDHAPAGRRLNMALATRNRLAWTNAEHGCANHRVDHPGLRHRRRVHG